MQPAVIHRSKRILLAAIAVLSLAGIIDSAVALQRHFAKSSTTYCDFSQQFNCDIVNRSEYSSIAGIPVAAIGIAGYAVLFLLSTLWRGRPETPTRLAAASVAGLAFALYLTYVEAYELMTWCILCLLSLGLISLIAALSIALKLHSRKT